jgi:predicted transcriptional regulator
MTDTDRARVRNSGEPLDPAKLIKLRKEFITEKGVGLSRVELAELTGVTRDAIAKYENGERRPRLGNFRNLCKALNAQPFDLYLESE